VSAPSCNTDHIASLVRSGEPDALSTIARCCADRLLAVGRQQCRLPSEAEDAVQDALLAASEHLSDYRGDGSIEAWLSTIVARSCARMRRGQKNDPRLHTHTETPSLGDDPESATARAELRDTLSVALSTLRPQDARMLWMADVEGHTTPELAAAEGLQPATVRARLSRARRRLRAQLSHAVKEPPT